MHASKHRKDKQSQCLGLLWKLLQGDSASIRFLPCQPQLMGTWKWQDRNKILEHKAKKNSPRTHTSLVYKPRKVHPPNGWEEQSQTGSWSCIWLHPDLRNPPPLNSACSLYWLRLFFSSSHLEDNANSTTNLLSLELSSTAMKRRGALININNSLCQQLFWSVFVYRGAVQ